VADQRALLGFALVFPVALGSVAAGAGDRRLPANVTIYDVVTHKSRGQISAEFQKYLANIGFVTTIDKCRAMMDYFQQMSSGRDTSFGVVCHIHTRRVSEDLTNSPSS
jgi:hypothetical protein